MKAQEQLSITDQSMTVSALLDGTHYKILLDSRSFMSKQYYIKNKWFQRLSKFSSKAKVIQVGKGESVTIPLIIPIIIILQSDIFEIHNMVS